MTGQISLDLMVAFHHKGMRFSLRILLHVPEGIIRISEFKFVAMPRNQHRIQLLGLGRGNMETNCTVEYNEGCTMSNRI